ncbi:MAG: hypothetical protein LBV51_00610 [Acholeplasmatales bacterium]|jgi:tRNA(Ile)-lysidine synthetase-like protein|nr:hypothetical protein [Acholeplasmatales bacterium]
MPNLFCNSINEYTKPRDLQLIEDSIRKTYKKDLFSPFVKAISDFELLKENDKVAVCVSGGKDSLLLAKLFQELKRHNKFNFDLVYICMNPGYTASNEEILKQNCEHLNIPIIIKESNVFPIIEKIAAENPCYLCARMRRGFLYSMAKELGCNKIALAHHFDDVIETTLINIFYGGQFKTMVPKIKAQNFEDIELIRPLIYVKEKDIKRYTIKNEIVALNCGCTVAALKTASKRHEVKELLDNLKITNPNVENSIFKSAINVNIDACLGYIQNGNKYSFNDIYINNSKYRTFVKEEKDE